MDFIEDHNLEKHKEYLGRLKIKYSVLLKSEPLLSGLSVKKILRSKVKEPYRSEALSLLGEIELHRLFFRSFSNKANQPCPALRRFFGSEANFCYRIFNSAMKMQYGFCCLVFRRGNLEIMEASDPCVPFVSAEPILAIDVWEHAYFADFGFDKERYLSLAVARLDLNKITEFFKSD